jgi:hypothetical protein
VAIESCLFHLQERQQVVVNLILMRSGGAVCRARILPYLARIGWEPRTSKKILTHALPTAVVDEELLKPREPFAVADIAIASLEFVANCTEHPPPLAPP